MAASLGEVDPKSARRLQDLARSVATEEGRQRWADVDLRRAFNTDRLSHAYAVRREGGYVPPTVDLADKVRNVMVLLPIFLTWAALAEAVRAYQRYIDANPDQVRLPFLLLWQQGFGENSGIFTPTFSALAIVDAVIIFIIIILTFYSHGRREAQEDAIAVTARDFQADLDNALAEATVNLAPDRAGRSAMLARSVERLAERFDMSTQELLTRLRVEHDRLEAIAARREKEFEDFGVFASGMRAGAEETHRLLIDLRQVSTSLQTSLEDLTSEIGVAGDQQRSLLTAVSSLERMVASGIQSDQTVTRQLADAAKSLEEASDKAISGAESSAQAGRIASDAVRGIAEIAASLASGQARVEHAIANESEANARLAESLRGAGGGVSAATKALADISSDLTRLRDEFARIGQMGAEQSSSLSRLLSEQGSIASGLSQVARDLSAVGISTSQRQREVHDEVAALVRRLDHVTAQLERVGGLPPTPQMVQQAVASSGRNDWPSQNAADADQQDYDPRSGSTQSGRRDRGLWPRRE
jgi:archaellum component FlaC